MEIAALGRTQMLFDSILALTAAGHKVHAIVTAPAAPEYTKTENDFALLGREMGIPVFVTTKLDRPEILTALRGCDLGISVNWISVLERRHIDLFKNGILNAHAGDLPAYRGNACPNWAIVRGEQRIALTIHKMEAGSLDCGAVIAQEFFEVRSDESISDVYSWLETIVPSCFVKAVSRLQDDPSYRLKIVGADEEDSFRCYPRIPEDGYIDWSRPAAEIHNLVRASGPPFAGAYCYMNLGEEAKKLVVLKTRLVADHTRDIAVSGQVMKNDPASGESSVACGEGVLALISCRFDGESQEFRPGERWRSIRLRLGIRPEDWLWKIYREQQPRAPLRSDSKLEPTR